MTIRVVRAAIAGILEDRELGRKNLQWYYLNEASKKISSVKFLEYITFSEKQVYIMKPARDLWLHSSLTMLINIEKIFKNLPLAHFDKPSNKLYNPFFYNLGTNLSRKVRKNEAELASLASNLGHFV